jgi:serine/threonine protein kinase
LKDNRYGRKSDIWSVGCTVLEMATGKLPWAEKDFENYMTAIYEIGNSDQIPFIPEGIPPSLDEFLRLCLIRDP